VTPPPRILAESSRVEAFSDGVLAIAITLLVLDLRTAAHPGHVGSELLAQWPAYLAYVASFIYIGVVWVNHHALFTRIASVDTGLLWCNLALLLAASVLPFPTAELAFAMGHGTRGDKVSALVLYAVISSALAATWLIMFSYLNRHPRLLREDVTAAFFRSERLRAVAGIIAPVVPVLIGLASPPLALLTMVAMPVFYAITAEGLRGPRAAASSADPEAACQPAPRRSRGIFRR
jgi:TMEM175 potassium channel family protein